MSEISAHERDAADAIATRLPAWFAQVTRPLPWRTPDCSAWGVLVSEVMSQQTPVTRVAPQWVAWMERWPTPADLAAASPAEVLRAWDRLGYPRRALRLQEAAAVIAAQHDNVVPTDVDALLALPGIGDYTARAVACFAYGQRVPVVDTNVRRVRTRLIAGEFLQPAAKKRDLADVERLLPADPALAATVSIALMELGSLVCTARAPRCDHCPLQDVCAWQLAGCPQPSEAELASAKRRVQKFAGTDRQVRGLLMAVLREADSPVEQQVLDAVWEDAPQRSRALHSLLIDGLAEQDSEGRFHLPQ